MSDPQIPARDSDNKSGPPPPKIPGAGGYSERSHFPNPPESVNPDAATLRDQWRYAIRQYSKWYSHAWGTAILAGLSFFALGWIIKGSNPIPSFNKPQGQTGGDKEDNDKDKDKNKARATTEAHQSR